MEETTGEVAIWVERVSWVGRTLEMLVSSWQLVFFVRHSFIGFLFNLLLVGTRRGWCLPFASLLLCFLLDRY